MFAQTDIQTYCLQYFTTLPGAKKILTYDRDKCRGAVSDVLYAILTVAMYGLN